MKRIVLFAALLVAAARMGWAGDVDLLAEGNSWRFSGGTEFPPGALGSFSVDEEGGAAIANLEYDFTQGGLYVAGAGNVRIEEGPTEIRFKFKADTPLTVGIRLVDKTNQTHQYQFAYTDEGQWQEYRVDLAEKAGLIFGGKGDKVLHFPITQVYFIAQKKGGSLSGKAQFRDVVMQ